MAQAARRIARLTLAAWAIKKPRVFQGLSLLNFLARLSPAVCISTSAKINAQRLIPIYSLTRQEVKPVRVLLYKGNTIVSNGSFLLKSIAGTEVSFTLFIEKIPGYFSSKSGRKHQG